jgi:hypothetical protein
VATTTTIWSKSRNLQVLDDQDDPIIMIQPPVQQKLLQHPLAAAATTASTGITSKKLSLFSSSSLPVLTAALALLLLPAALLPVPPSAAYAVSGVGLDYANLDFSGQDFSNQSYKGKDFTQVLAKATTSRDANLSGCRFYKASRVMLTLNGSAAVRTHSLIFVHSFLAHLLLPPTKPTHEKTLRRIKQVWSRPILPMPIYVVRV